MHGAPWSLRTGTGPGYNRIKRLAQTERAWLKAAWSYTMMLLVHAGGHSEGNPIPACQGRSNKEKQGQGGIYVCESYDREYLL